MTNDDLIRDLDGALADDSLTPAERQRLLAARDALIEPRTTGQGAYAHLTDEQIVEAVEAGEPMPSPPGCAWRRHGVDGAILGPWRRR